MVTCRMLGSFLFLVHVLLCTGVRGSMTSPRLHTGSIFEQTEYTGASFINLLYSSRASKTFTFNSDNSECFLTQKGSTLILFKVFKHFKHIFNFQQHKLFLKIYHIFYSYFKRFFIYMKVYSKRENGRRNYLIHVISRLI